MSLLTYLVWCCFSSRKDLDETGEKQTLHLVDTVLDLLSVLVEFWCQHHFKLNQSLVDKGLKDIAEHFAVISQGMEFGKEVIYREQCFLCGVSFV